MTYATIKGFRNLRMFKYLDVGQLRKCYLLIEYSGLQLNYVWRLSS